MALLDRIQKEMAEAMRARDEVRLSVLRMIKTALKKHEVDAMKPLDEATEMQVLNTLVKQRRDSIAQYEAGKRQDLADAEKFEITVVQAYMPQALSEAAIAAAIAEAVQASGAKAMSDMGKVMAVLKPKLAGKADMGKVSALVKAKLAG